MFAQIKKLLGMGVDPGQIARPSGVSRRDFMKALGVTGVSVSMGGILLPYKQDLVVDTELLDRMSEMRFTIDDPTLVCPYLAEKQAIDAVNIFTRDKMREDGFFRRILPPIVISNDELDRVVTVPRARLEENPYIRGPRYSPFREQMRRQNGEPALTPRFLEKASSSEEARKINEAIFAQLSKPGALCNCGKHKHLDGSQPEGFLAYSELPGSDAGV